MRPAKTGWGEFASHMCPVSCEQMQRSSLNKCLVQPWLGCTCAEKPSQPMRPTVDDARPWKAEKTQNPLLGVVCLLTKSVLIRVRRCLGQWKPPQTARFCGSMCRRARRSLTQPLPPCCRGALSLVVSSHQVISGRPTRSRGNYRSNRANSAHHTAPGLRGIPLTGTRRMSGIPFP